MPLKDVGEVHLQGHADGVVLCRIRRQERGDDAAPRGLCSRLSEALEEVLKNTPPRLVLSDLLPCVHENLVDENEGPEPILLRKRQEPSHEILSRRSCSLFGKIVGMDEAETGVTGQLESQHAPRLLEPSERSVRGGDLKPLLYVQLVKTEPDHPALRRLLTNLLDELANRGKIGKCLRIIDEVAEGDECMCLAAAIGQLKLADGLVVFPREAEHDIPHELAEVECWVGKGKELLRPLVNGVDAALHKDLVEVGGKKIEREVTAPQVIAKTENLVPGFPGKLVQFHPPILYSTFAITRHPSPDRALSPWK